MVFQINFFSIGKSTLANACHCKLFERNIQSYILDGDNIRHGINKDLGFSDQDRVENIRRVGEIARLFMDAGMITLTAFVSPFRDDREQVRQLIMQNGGSATDFIEIYCNAALNICEDRDTKGLYKRARAGSIPNFTGISSPYEEPECPELDIDTGNKSLDDCVEIILKYLEEKGIIPRA